jgi:hypothetical protein
VQSRLRFLMNNIQNYTMGNLLLHPWPFEICDPATPHTSFFFLGLHRRPQAQSAGVKDFDLRGAVVDFKTKVSAWASGDKGGLTREVEMSLPSYSPHDQMILRVDLMGSHGRWTRPCLTAHMTILKCKAKLVDAVPKKLAKGMGLSHTPSYTEPTASLNSQRARR